MWIGRLSRLLGPVSQCAFVFFFLRDVGSLGSKRHEINALVVTSCSHRKERRNCSDNKARDAEAPLCVLPSHVLSVPCKQTLCLPLIYIHTQLRAHTHTSTSSHEAFFWRENLADSWEPRTSLWLIGRVYESEGGDASNPGTNKSPWWGEKRSRGNTIKKSHCGEQHRSVCPINQLH